MPKQDSLLKDFFKSNEHFIDLFNAKFFEGKEVLKPECCREINPVYQTKDEKERTVDVSRLYKDIGVLSIFIIENQSYVDYSMVIRSLEYMTEAYRNQMKEKRRKLNKKDSLGMVYLIVFYTGEKQWDGAKRLSELVNVPKEFKSSFQDFEMNLIEINGESSYNFSNKDVKDLVNMTRCVYDQSIHTQEKLLEFNDSTREVRKIVGKITDTDWIVQDEESEDIEMCEAERAWERKIESRGLERGVARGVEQGQNEIIKTLSKTMTVVDIARALNKTTAEIENILKN